MSGPMVRFLHDLPMRRKLMLVTTLISGVALVVACALFATYDYITFRQQMVKELVTSADLIGANSTAAISFSLLINILWRTPCMSVSLNSYISSF